MKRIILATLSILLLATMSIGVHGFPGPSCLLDVVSAAETLVPAPFDAAKRYAMAQPLDADGDYVLNFEINEGGEQSRIGLIYLKENRWIHICRDLACFACNEENGAMRAVMLTPDGVVELQMGREEIIDECFKIFRELVTRKLLGVCI